MEGGALENLDALKTSSNEDIFDWLFDQVERRVFLFLSAELIRDLFMESNRREATELISLVLEITEVRDDVDVADLLIEAAEWCRDPFVSLEIADQLLSRSEFEDIHMSVFINFITRKYDLVILYEGAEEAEYGAMPKSYVSRQLLLMNFATDLDAIRKAFEEQTILIYSRLDMSALLFIETGLNEYFEFIQGERNSPILDVARYARECCDIIKGDGGGAFES